MAVAVRSSATAEDLPSASFAGQQETFLNVTGPEAVLDAVRRCWASLWTDRAVAYRARQGVEQAGVRLAVVVQRMVDAGVSGVLFTADPVSGTRHRAVIEASPGLGEAVVAGATNPDRFVVDLEAGEIVARRLGDKRRVVVPRPGGGVRREERRDQSDTAAVDDRQLHALARLGADVEALFGSPQDIEFAIDVEERVWLLQARPITTVFPVPAPSAQRDGLRVFLSVNVIQGFNRPFTPMGLQALRLTASAMAALFGARPRDPQAGPAVLVEAGQRLFLDATPLMRSSLGRRALRGIASIAEARTAGILQPLLLDSRLTPRPTRWAPLIRAAGSLLARTRLPLRIARALLDPSAARARAVRAAEAALAPQTHPPDDPGAWLDEAKSLLLRARCIPAAVAPVIIAGLGSYALAGRLAHDLATSDELQVVLRGLPHNPTTEMDLALWDLARRASADPSATRALSTTPPQQLAQDYRRGLLPQPLQSGLATFLDAYGHRSVGEIDLGLPRWSEDPAHILGAMAAYVQISDPAMAPDVQFRRAADAGEAVVVELVQRARTASRPRGALLAFLLGRTRSLAGMREAAKFYLIALFARARTALCRVGEALAQAGRLEASEDVFFLTLSDAQRGLSGEDLRSVVRAGRSAYAQELKRRHIPRVLLSDGTEPTAVAAAPREEGSLVGTPVSPGLVTGSARVVLEPSDAKLSPGEILVAPSTDPGWTPLFLAAGGLVMEMGGVMSHGAVVAREYGIPAVVGVPDATERIRTSQRLTVDGTSGVVHVARSSDDVYENRDTAPVSRRAAGSSACDHQDA